MSQPGESPTRLAPPWTARNLANSSRSIYSTRFRAAEINGPPLWTSRRGDGQGHGARSEPDLPLPALRAHGDLLEIRAEDVRLTDDEAAVLINDEFGLELSSDDLGTLIGRTEGWPAGVYLAALSIPRAADPHEFVAHPGRDRSRSRSGQCGMITASRSSQPE